MKHNSYTFVTFFKTSIMEHAKLSEFTDDIVSIKPLFYRSFGRPGYLNSNITQIGELLYISKPNVTTLIDKLIEKGFTERLHDKQDRRIINIKVTKKGLAFVEKSQKEFGNQVKKKLLTLSEEELNKLIVSFQTIKEIMSKISTAKN